MSGNRDHPRQRLLLRVEEAAELLGIGRSITYELIRDGILRSVKIGRLRRVPTNALPDAIAELERRTHDHQHQDDDES